MKKLNKTIETAKCPKDTELQEDMITSPEQLLLKPSRKLIEKHLKRLLASSFMNFVHIKYEPEYRKPKNSKDLVEVGNIVCTVKKLMKVLTLLRKLLIESIMS